MCGRIALYRNTNDVAERFEFEHLELELTAHYNLFPGKMVPAIIQDQKRRLARCKWGLVPFWAMKFGKNWKPRAHARMETMTENMFAQSVETRRCLIPLNGYFEFNKARGKGSIPHYFYRSDQELFSVAAIWESVRTPEGILQSMAIVTCPSNKLNARAHPRMPVIFEDREQEELWLDPGNRNLEELKKLCVTLPDEFMAGHRAPDTVNNAANDFPGLIEPVRELTK